PRTSRRPFCRWPWRATPPAPSCRSMAATSLRRRADLASQPPIGHSRTQYSSLQTRRAMPEADAEGARYQAETPQAAPGFFLKGSHQLDWGMKNRLARVFSPQSGRTVMLAVDHGYFQGPTTGLERIDLNIVPLLPHCDALFCTRGILRSVIPAEAQRPMVLRASGGPSILKELSDEQIAMDMEDAARLNAAGVGIQVFVGGEHETRSIHNMTRPA